MIIIFGLAGIIIGLVLLSWILDGGISDLYWYIKNIKDEEKRLNEFIKHEEESRNAPPSNGLRWEGGAFVNEAPMSEAELKKYERMERHGNRKSKYKEPDLSDYDDFSWKFPHR